MGITVRGAPPRCQYARVPGPAGARHAHSDPGLPQAPVFTAPETQVACGHTPNSGPCRYPGCCDNHKAPVQAPAKKPPLVVNPANPQAYRSILRAHTREPDAPNPWLTRRQIAQGAWDAGRWSFCRLTLVVKKKTVVPSGAPRARQHARDVTPSPDPDREAAGIFSEAPLAHPMRIRHRPCGGFLTLSGFGDATGSCQMTAGSCTIHPTTR